MHATPAEWTARAALLEEAAALMTSPIAAGCCRAFAAVCRDQVNGSALPVSQARVLEQAIAWAQRLVDRHRAVFGVMS